MYNNRIFMHNTGKDKNGYVILHSPGFRTEEKGKP